MHLIGIIEDSEHNANFYCDAPVLITEITFPLYAFI